jgi:type I restriction enzyme S subunit
MSETLEAMARALFKSWFVDFDPVRAKMEGRWRRGQSLPGLPAHLYDLFPERLVDSELGEIPEGWEVAAVGDFVECVKGKSYKSEHLQHSDTALVTLKSFARGGGYRPDGLKPYKGDYKPEQVIRPRELVVACTDVTQAAEVIGKPALVRSDDRFTTLVASLDVLIVRPKSKAVSVPFLYCLFRTDAFSEHTYAHATGTTVLHLDKIAVPSFKFARPTRDVANAFANSADRLFRRIDEVESESRTLAALRDTLLPKLISGELRVKDAQRFLERAGA